MSKSTEGMCFGPEGFKTVLDILWPILGKALVPLLLPILIYKILITKVYLKTLESKVVLITGASSGLGEALAQSFYRVGCKVILASRRIDELTRVKRDLMKMKCANVTFEPAILQIDLMDIDSLPMKAREAEMINGSIDILINNGGVSFRGDIVDTSIDVHINVMTVNYFGPVALTRALLPNMIKRGNGNIVIISSVQGKIAIPHRSAYAASKHALQAFFDCLRSEIAHTKVKVTVVSPGYIKTNLSKNAITNNGTTYGVTDPNTASGFDPCYVSSKVLAAVTQEKKEIIVSTLGPKIAIILRAILPSLYYYLMKKRANKN